MGVPDGRCGLEKVPENISVNIQPVTAQLNSSQTRVLRDWPVKNRGVNFVATIE
jgi:hypothetical protein